MATLREIRRRISGVKNTQKITRAMKMVASAKLRRAQEAVVSARPYAFRIGELLRFLLSNVDSSQNPLFAPRNVGKIAVIIVTADRGLCGAFNSNIIRAASQHIDTEYSDLLKGDGNVKFITVGKKGFDYFNKHDYRIFSKQVGIFQDLDFSLAKNIVGEFTGAYLKGEFDKVMVIYNEFKSAVQQKIVIEQILPIPPPDKKIADEEESLANIEYIFEPSSAEIIEKLLPKHLDFQMWKILLESSAAEQGARMAAMENATENAKEMIRDLTLSYNNARQAAITKELLEITGGADALKKAG